MKRENIVVILLFFGSIFLVASVIVGVDVWLKVTDPAGGDTSTISWSMALLGARNPFAVFMIGFASGSAVIGLAVHFWAGLPTPALWDEVLRLRAENAKLKGNVCS